MQREQLRGGGENGQKIQVFKEDPKKYFGHGQIEGRTLEKKKQISQVIRTGLPILENLSGPCAIIFSLLKILQLYLN